MFLFCLVLAILPQNALRCNRNSKCIERNEGHYLEVVVEVYVFVRVCLYVLYGHLLGKG